jgi:glyoxylase-like metal-dependent hydrolase (beta-lactamase superfamily II)
MTARILTIGLVAAALGGSPCLAQVTAEQLAAAEIRTEKVGDNLYVLFGLGGNIAVSVGADGVLAVDTEFPELVPRYLAAIRAVGGGEIDIAINTHWHYDHADGNLVLGPTGTWLVAQANSRAMLTKDNVINTVSGRCVARGDVHGPHAAEFQRRGHRPHAHWTGAYDGRCRRDLPQP